MPGPSFLAIGECMVEMAPAPGGLFRMGFAGDTFNTAWYARRLLPAEWTVGYATAVGDDAVSRAMLEFMGGEGIDTGTVRRIPGRTVGLYMIRLEQGERSFSYWRGQSAARALADDADWLDRILSGRDLLFFSGITMAILGPEGRATLVAALGRARALGAQVALDTNLRPRLWESEAAMRAGLTHAAAVADIVLPSFDEETGLFGDARPEETVARYRDLGATLVAVKNGQAPAHLWSAREGARIFTPPHVAEVVDSTAAGDSFDAGLLAALLTGATLDEAATRAMTLAARVIGKRGALAPDLFEGQAAQY
ncbi:sugar kinase [Limibaculum sp. FT325]|uniref:sugar kinase n=1 Tax=Thermohalobaculum sediminis TaxID=2939436 RepID=UPI0020C076A1|nr:sugar kinase [Limibaculum sediminis]MCL5778116.1 sugar kinase [Limibaculum sediminis]